MKHSGKWLFAGTAFMLLAGTGAAFAEPGFVSERTALRAGPGVRYPTIEMIRRGDDVNIIGCLPRWTWCDVTWEGERGWVRGAALQVDYQSRRSPISRNGRNSGVPFIEFNVNRYWGDYYRERPFYQQIPRFGGRDDRPAIDNRSPDRGPADDRRPDRRPDRGADRPATLPPPPQDRGPGPFGGGRPTPQPSPPQAAPAPRPQQDGGRPFGGGAQQQPPQAEPPAQAAPQRRGRKPEEDAPAQRQPFGGPMR